MKTLTMIAILGLGIGLTWGTYLINSSEVFSNWDWARHLSEIAVLPAMVISVLISGNVHHPNDWLMGVFVFLTYEVVIVLIWNWVRRGIRSAKSNA
jgi:hypothetical protein